MINEPITAAEGLEALPERSVFRDRHDDVGVVHLGQVWYPDTAPLSFEYVAKHYFPAVVLYRPDASPGQTIAQWQRAVGDVNRANGWRQATPSEYASPTKQTATLALIMTEVAEAIEEVRAGRAMDEAYYTINGKKVYRVTDGSGADWTTDPGGISVTSSSSGDATYTGLTAKPEGVPSELADVVIRVLDIADLYGIDLEATIAEKVAHNATRGHRHGGKTL